MLTILNEVLVDARCIAVNTLKVISLTASAEYVVHPPKHVQPTKESSMLAM